MMNKDALLALTGQFSGENIHIDVRPGIKQVNPGVRDSKAGKN